ncbi:MAG: reverse transcriptase family protein, partial [Oscillospiraceae bacterium]
LTLLKQKQWRNVLECSDTQIGFNIFYEEMHALFDEVYPLKHVRRASTDPTFVTAEIKSLLRRKNKKMRKGRIEEANAISETIRHKIETKNSKTFTDQRRGSKELWKTVNQITGKSKQNKCPSSHFNADTLNKYFCSVSTDSKYVHPPRKQTASVLQPSSALRFTEYYIFKQLDSLKHTSPGLDTLPSWFLKLAAPSIAEPIAYLFNLSLMQSVVPLQWKVGIITPVAKTSNPVNCQDFRPISVTPILARLFEKFIVRKFLYPILIHESHGLGCRDQFAFRPTGSTTAALINLVSLISDSLLSSDYVRVVSFDVSKAFDSLRHQTLLEKLSNMPIPDNVYNWLVDFFLDRSHVTTFRGNVSSSAKINASIVQGSGIGPVCYILNSSDLHPVTQFNKFSKYADDVDLIVPSFNSHSIEAEFDNINSWAELNNLKLNKSKTKELIIYKSKNSRNSNVNSPLEIPGVERVTNLKILGVLFDDVLSFGSNLEHIIRSAASTFYALKTISLQNLSGSRLFDVTRQTLVARMLYASPVWWGFMSETQKARLNAVIRRAVKLSYLPHKFCSFIDLCDQSDESLFSQILNNHHHVIHHLLPEKKVDSYNLRQRSHDRILPLLHTSLLKNNFLNRMLYLNSY